MLTVQNLTSYYSNIKILKDLTFSLRKGKVTVIAETIVEATRNLLKEMISDDHEIITLVAGRDSNKKETDEVVAWVSNEYEALEVEVHEGGQPLYQYYIGIE